MHSGGLTVTAEQVKDKYTGRIMAVMNRIRTELQAAGFTVDEPWSSDCDDYRWEMVVHMADTPAGAETKVHDDDLDIAFKICESQEYDGTDAGVNFAVDIVQFGGRMLGGLCPFNYSEDVWVPLDNEDAIEQRFRIMEQADTSEIPSLVER
jgi:hypothetical protein